MGLAKTLIFPMDSCVVSWVLQRVNKFLFYKTNHPFKIEKQLSHNKNVQFFVTMAEKQQDYCERKCQESEFTFFYSLLYFGSKSTKYTGKASLQIGQIFRH